MPVAVLSCALLRYTGIADRLRCGFATYFQPGQGLDHWITQYWHEQEKRWGSIHIRKGVLGRCFAFAIVFVVLFYVSRATLPLRPESPAHRLVPETATSRWVASWH